MRKLFSLWLSSLDSRRRKPRRRPGRWEIESLERRQLLSANVIQVVTGTTFTAPPLTPPPDPIPIGTIDTETYSGGTGGTFTLASQVGLPTNPMMGSPVKYGYWSFVGSGDVNGDGNLDIIAFSSGVANQNQNASLWVGINNGSNSYSFGATPTPWDGSVPVNGTVAAIGGGTVSTQLTYTDFKVADFTGYGKADVLARVAESGEWDIWIANAAGTGFYSRQVFGIFGAFGSTTVDANATQKTPHEWDNVMVGDFNGDGKADVIGREIIQGGSNDQWFIGLGSAPNPTTHLVTSLGYADASDTVSTGWWKYTTTLHSSTSSTFADAVVGDFNKDGKTDLATLSLGATDSTGARDGVWTKYLSNGTSSAPTSTQWIGWHQQSANAVQLVWTDIQTGDLDGDGADDLLVRRGDNSWWYVSGTATYNPLSPTYLTQISSALGSQYTTSVAGDFTGDGRWDLAVYNTSDHQWYLSWTTSGTPSFSTLTAKGGTVTINTTDLDRWRYNVGNTGSIPSNAVSNMTNHVDFYQNHTGTISALNPLEAGDRYQAFTNVTSYVDPYMMYGRFDADNSWHWQAFGGGALFAGATVKQQVTGDFNGDRLLDLLTSVTVSGTSKWYLSVNMGNAYATTLLSSLTVSATSTIYVGHFASYTSGAAIDGLLIQAASGSTATWTVYSGWGSGPGTGLTNSVSALSLSSSTHDGWLTGGIIASLDSSLHLDDIAIQKASTTVFGQYDIWVAMANMSVSSGGTLSGGFTLSGPTYTRTLNQTSAIPGITGQVTTIYDYLRADDVDGDGTQDLISIQELTISVPPPNLSAKGAEIWVGWGGSGSSQEGAVITTGGSYVSVSTMIANWPDTEKVFNVGRFAGNDNSADVLMGYSNASGGNITVWKSLATPLSRPGAGAVFTEAIHGTSGAGGLATNFVGDVDNDGQDDLVWVQIASNLSNLNINLMVPTTIATSTNTQSGVPTLYVMPDSPVWIGETLRRIRRRP